MDKHSALHPTARGLMLDVGCGRRKKNSDYIGIDRLDAPEVDVVGDVFEVLGRLAPGSVARVYSSHFFEHVGDVERLLTDLARVLEVDGELEIVVPHFSNPYFYSDLTHQHSFGLYSFSYFFCGSPFKRQVPTYGNNLPFWLARVNLGFKSPRPFYVRYAVKRFTGLLFNATRGLKEFYEENLCYLVPCYEISFLLVRQ